MGLPVYACVRVSPPYQQQYMCRDNRNSYTTAVYLSNYLPITKMLLHIRHFINKGQKDLPEAKYKLGQKVLYAGQVGTIMAMKATDGQIEYCLNSVPDKLLREDELGAAPEPNEWVN